MWTKTWFTQRHRNSEPNQVSAQTELTSLTVKPIIISTLKHTRSMPKQKPPSSRPNRIASPTLKPQTNSKPKRKIRPKQRVALISSRRSSTTEGAKTSTKSRRRRKNPRRHPDIDLPPIVRIDPMTFAAVHRPHHQRRIKTESTRTKTSV